ncbi:MAG: DUF4062 domain-containing protein [Candidatus Eisenbacteria bacterium]|nr:DUF4062 domain-containing protein [Candidatus Eisenbacteria bacterium]
MARRDLTFRVFVSSTFSDLIVERNALHERVFPKLRELCLQHSCRFQAIDLRWGVSQEATLDQQTMNICLQELERCRSITPRPNFMVLLGDRYGWQPLPPQIEAGEFEAILEWVSPEEKKLLLWGDDQPKGSKGWYRKDENAVPAEYCLRPRELNVPENVTDKERRGALDREAKEWEETERMLRSILLRALDQLGWPEGDPRRIKHEYSATHQEIIDGALRVPDAHEHVYCFFREIEGLPIESSARGFIDLDETGHLDSDARGKLQSLKQSMRDLLPGNVREYKVGWAGRGVTTEHLNELCDDVYSGLSRVILEQIRTLEKVDELKTEIEEHESWGKERARFFTGRTSILQRISDYLRGTDTHPLAIFGVSGSGKTALMAHAAQKAREMLPGARVVVRFIGATPGSSDGRSVLEDACRHIYRVFDFEEQKQNLLIDVREIGEEEHKKRQRIKDEYSIPTEFQKLCVTFQEFVAKIPRSESLILFLDALEQLSESDDARSLSWLPTELPPNVRLIVSCLVGKCLSVLQEALPAANLVELGSMEPQEGERLLDLWLQDARRTLQPRQGTEILAKFRKCALPLYMRLAFEEVRLWKSHTEQKELGLDIGGVIGNLFQRLSSDANHGRVVVSRSLGYLAAAKNGLAEDELLDILSQDEEVVADFLRRSPRSPRVKQLPVAVWSRLYFELKPYLTERRADRTSLLGFYHMQVRQVVTERYLQREREQIVRDGLIQYFGCQPHQLVDSAGGKAPNARKLSELPFALRRSCRWIELSVLLTDYDFVEAEVQAGMVIDLVGHYGEILAAGTSRLEGQEEVQLRAWANFVRSSAHLLLRGDDPFFQLALNHADRGPVVAAAEERARYHPGPWLRLLNRPVQAQYPACFRTLEGHTDGVSALALTPDGRRIVSGSADRTLRLWDLESGQCVRTLGKDIETIESLEVSPDGRRVVSSCRYRTVRVWDLEGGRCLRTYRGGWGVTEKVTVTPDAHLAISYRVDRRLTRCGGPLKLDGTLRVWDLDVGDCVRSLVGHRERVRAVVVSADGQIALSVGEDGIRVWALRTGQCLWLLGRASTWVVAMTPDGHRAVTCSFGEEALRIWDLSSGRSLQTFIGQSSVRAVAITPDGRRVVSVGFLDKMLRVWDTESGACVGTIGAAPDTTTLAIKPDGGFAVSGGWRGTIKVWDLSTGEDAHVNLGHRKSVETVVVTPDGRMGVSGGSGSTLRIWDLGTGDCVRVIEWTGVAEAIEVTPDGTRLVLSGENRLSLWNLETGECIKRLSGDTNWADVIVVTPDGRRLISGGSDGGVRVWDLHTGEHLQVLEGHTDCVRTLVITPDGRQVISGSDDKSVRVWDVESGECVRELIGHTDAVEAIALSPDAGRLVSAGGFDLTLRVWNLESGECLHILQGHKYRVKTVEVTPDGEQAVSAALDDTVRVWNLQSGECLHALAGHRDRIIAIAVSQDGRHLVSGGMDGTVRVWDLVAGRQIACFSGWGYVRACALSPDCRRILAGGESALVGHVFLLALENAVHDPLIATGWRSTVNSRHVMRCPHCRTWSAISESYLGATLRCPVCHRLIRLNRFTISGNYRPIQAAWRSRQT